MLISMTSNFQSMEGLVEIAILTKTENDCNQHIQTSSNNRSHITTHTFILIMSC